MYDPNYSEDYGRKIAAAIAGDKKTLQDLVIDCEYELSSYITRQIGPKLGCVLDTDDVFQETWASAVRCIASTHAKTRECFIAWLKRIARNRIHDAARRNATEKRGGEVSKLNLNDSCSLSLFEEISSNSDSPSTFATRKEVIEATRKALFDLPENQQTAIILHHNDGLTIAETARRMGKTAGAVKGLVERAKAAMKKMLRFD